MLINSLSSSIIESILAIEKTSRRRRKALGREKEILFVLKLIKQGNLLTLSPSLSPIL